MDAEKELTVYTNVVPLHRLSDLDVGVTLAIEYSAGWSVFERYRVTGDTLAGADLYSVVLLWGEQNGNSSPLSGLKLHLPTVRIFGERATKGEASHGDCGVGAYLRHSVAGATGGPDFKPLIDNFVARTEIAARLNRERNIQDQGVGSGDAVDL